MTLDGNTRPWRQIARELEKEGDPRRILDLATELNAALDAEGAIARPADRKAQEPPRAVNDC